VAARGVQKKTAGSKPNSTFPHGRELSILLLIAPLALFLLTAADSHGSLQRKKLEIHAPCSIEMPMKENSTS